jgi:CubicO group peptidase (beta-lactamase class C family)/beta-glucosidase-like glycosyl hydrolase
VAESTLLSSSACFTALPTPRGLARGLAALIVLALGACARGEPQSPWSEARLARMTLRERVAQMVVARVEPLGEAPSPADSARVRLLRWARGGIGGVELIGGEARDVSALTDSLRLVPLPPLVAARAVQGLGVAFPGATELPGVEGLAVLGDSALAAAVGAITASEAKALGIDLLFVPGPPLPSDTAALLPATLARPGNVAYAAYVRALAAAGRLPAVTAFRAPYSAVRPTLVAWDRAALGPVQLDYLEAVIGGGAAAFEPGFSTVPALTGDTTPLPFSGVAVQGLVRRDLGFNGLVTADVSPRSPLARGWGAIPAAVAAIQVGAELVIGVVEPEAMVDGLTAAVERGTIPRANVERAVRRIFAAKRRAEVGSIIPDSLKPRLRAEGSAAAAADAFERTAVALGPVPALRGCRKVVLLAQPGAAVEALHAELARRVPGVLRLGSWGVPRHGPVSGLKDFAGNDADCAVAADLPRAPMRVAERIGPAVTLDTSAAARRDTARFRARRAAYALDTLTRRIVFVALAADPARALPEVRTALLAWGAGAQAQRSAVRALFAEPRRDGGPRPRVAWPAARRLVRADAKSAGMNAEGLAKIDEILARGVDTGVFTAAAVAVGRHGRLVKLRGYGRVAGGPVDPAATLFDVASLTKVMGTTPAVMALVDDGRIDLEAPAVRYVSQFRGGGRGDVTVWNLMTHTAGLPAGSDLYHEAGNREKALGRVMKTDLVAEPGKQVLYSDFGMIVMAEAVRRRAGEGVDTFAARRVFVPLGMRNTMYDPPLLAWSRTVPTALRSERPYTTRDVVHDGNAFRLGGVAGHAGLFSTAGDMAIYAQTLLNLGAYGDRRIWSPRTVQAFTTRQTRAGTRAIGWDTPAARSSSGDWFSARSYGHTGFTGTSIWIDPERDLFVILLTNRTYDAGTQGQILEIRRAVADAAARSITDVPIRPRPGTAAAAAEAAAERARARERARERAKHRPRRPTRPRGRRN